ncbi:HAMP domain-containing protein [Heliorestis acidaminivorans]|uniref:HAMP domain-containing protein n=1 Tax=Heliorestis acidaminivorans TaxID=553427 RepID=A0A6I0EXN3_9FIRM|nr:HAMP domain-containing methyl-accepting chemotaxis protein [Heliorestis acidaminivorans]KAB2951382.1 HAMP domain-containing protein [Heliorestis acidaminivorans]
MERFLKFKVGTRILLVILFSTIVLLSIGIFGMYNLNIMNDEVDQLYEESLLPTRYLGEVRTNLQGYRVTTYNHFLANNIEDKQVWYQRGSDYLKNFRENLSLYKQTNINADELRTVNEIESALQEYVAIVERSLQASLNGDVAGAMQIAGQARNIAFTLDGSLDNLVSMQVRVADEKKVYTDNLYGSTVTTTIIIIAVGVIVSFGLGVLLSRSIAKPLGELERIATKIAQGDLTENAGNTQGDDELSSLSRSIHLMVNNLRNFVKKVQEGAEAVAASSQQISASSQQMASGSQAQAEEAQGISNMMSDMAGAATQVAQSAQKAALSSESTTASTLEGGAIIEKTVSGMDNVAKNVMSLGQSSEKIGEIVEMIDDIASQTNLLALNAAIEAARAGDAGKGFAVVADEVRKLAERSGTATKEIATLIKGIQADTGKAVDAVKDGREYTQKAGEAFQTIKDQVRQTAGEVGEIAAAAEEQAATSDQATKAVQNVAAIAEETSAGVEEMAGAIQSMSHLATELQEAATKYKV